MKMLGGAWRVGDFKVCWLSTSMPGYRRSGWNRSVDGGWLVVIVEKIQAFCENCKRSALGSKVIYLVMMENVTYR